MLTSCARRAGLADGRRKTRAKSQADDGIGSFAVSWSTVIGALLRAGAAVALAAPLGACGETINEAIIGRTPYVNESGTAPMRPGYLNQNGCQIGTHGVPFPNGNGFVCRVNVQ
jgi:hypothetical protein